MTLVARPGFAGSKSVVACRATEPALICCPEGCPAVLTGPDGVYPTLPIPLSARSVTLRGPEFSRCSNQAVGSGDLPLCLFTMLVSGWPSMKNTKSVVHLAVTRCTQCVGRIWIKVRMITANLWFGHFVCDLKSSKLAAMLTVPVGAGEERRAHGYPQFLSGGIISHLVYEAHASPPMSKYIMRAERT